MRAAIIAFAMLLQMLNSPTGIQASHPLDLVPKKATGAIVFPNMSRFKKDGDALINALGIGFTVSQAMAFCGAELGVSGAADDDKPIAILWLDGKLVGDPKRRASFEIMAAAIPISDFARLAKNLKSTEKEIKSGRVIRNGRESRQARFFKFANNYLWTATHEELFKHVINVDAVTDGIPKERLDVLGKRDVITIFNAEPQKDQVSGFQKQAEQWVSEHPDADDEEKETVREFLLLLSRTDHVALSVTVKEGLQIDADLIFSEEDVPAVNAVKARLNKPGRSSHLTGLPTGRVLFAHASGASGRGSLPALSIMKRELFRNWGPSWKRLDHRGFLSQSEQLEFLGIFDEVWHQLDGYRVAAYHNENVAHGLMNVVAILDTKDPKAFIKDMKQLAGFVDGTGVPTGDDIPGDATRDLIQKLIGDLGNRSFRKRNSATNRLILIGEPALATIQDAKKSEVKEVARRAVMIEQRINRAMAETRDRAVNPSLLAKADPKFVFFAAHETREGSSVHLVEIETRPTAELRASFRVLFGPKWQQIRLVPLKNKVVVAVGSNVKLLDKTLANLANGESGLGNGSAVIKAGLQEQQPKSQTVFPHPLHAKRGVEFHLSPSQFVEMQSGKPINQKLGQFKNVSLGMTLQPRFLNIEWRIPQDQIRVVWKNLWF